LGIVEGATEYLPISSTFHLIWAARILGIEQSQFQKAFEVIIQAGSILAVVFLYFSQWRSKISLFPKILSSFIPTGIAGLLLYKVIKGTFFENYVLQLGVFALVGLVFIFFEKFYRPKVNRRSKELTYKESIVIGLIQALAIIPGVSRAGAVILGMMFLKVRRDEAAEYSFLLAVPTLLAASSLDLVKTVPYLLDNTSDIGVLLVGFIAAFISALFAIKWFITFLQKHSLTSFGIYRLALAVLLIALFFPK